jgi:hypothetical protein
LNDLQSQYDSLSREAQDARTGTPSPFAGEVSLSAANAQESGADEYLELDNHGRDAVTITGWTIESVFSGVRFVIPPAANPFVLGSVNRVANVSLAPGETAIVGSGASPVGVSFRENMCSGFLTQSQSFAPELESNCPAAASVMPLTSDNLTRYGSDCIDYAASIPDCEFPSHMPSSLSSSCRVYLGNALSYNGCVSTNQSRVGFASGTWRLYLGAGVELWNNRHDIIRLLDANGRIVDAITY